jgi:hypothetical protein
VAFSLPAASFPLLDLDGPLAGGLPVALSLSDVNLGDVPVELVADLAHGVDGKITGTATLDEGPASGVTLDLTCDVGGKVRGKGLSTKLIVKLKCDGDIDTGLGFGLRAGEATLKLVYRYDRVLDQFVRKASLRIKVLNLFSHRLKDKQVFAGAPGFFPAALDWDLDVSIAPDPADVTGRRLLATATATLFGGATSIDFTGAGKYKEGSDASSLKFTSDVVPGASFTLKKAVVDPAAVGPDDALESYVLRYKIMGQTGTLIVAPPAAP